jgi:hypothetical protein
VQRSILALITAVLVIGCSSPPPEPAKMPIKVDPGNSPFNGVYRQQGSDLDGSLYRLEVIGDGRFAIANLSSVFYGTWAEKDGQVTLTIVEGSSGKLSSPVKVEVAFSGGDTVGLGEEWGGAPFMRQRAAQYLISFEGTSLDKR